MRRKRRVAFQKHGFAKHVQQLNLIPAEDD